MPLATLRHDLYTLRCPSLESSSLSLPFPSLRPTPLRLQLEKQVAVLGLESISTLKRLEAAQSLNAAMRTSLHRAADAVVALASCQADNAEAVQEQENALAVAIEQVRQAQGGEGSGPWG